MSLSEQLLGYDAGAYIELFDIMPPQSCLVEHYNYCLAFQQ